MSPPTQTQPPPTTTQPGILQVLPALQSGGVERGTIDIADSIAAAGFRSYVASSGGGMVRLLAPHKTQHITLPLNTKNPFQIYLNRIRLATLIREHNIQLVHARSRAPAWSAYLAAKDTGCHFVTTFHGIYNINNALKRYYNSVMTKGDTVIAISDFTASHIKENYRIDPQKLVTIPRGVDMAAFNPLAISQQRIITQLEQLFLPTDRKIIMLPGRITRWKGHLYMIEALKYLPRGSYYCLFLGDDKGHKDYRKEIEKKIADYQMQDDIGIAGNTSDMAAAYMLADIVVSASIEPEAFGRISIEAQAMGRPLIATAIGGSCETVIDGKTGWLVPTDRPEIFAKTLMTLLDLDSDARLQLGKISRQHIQDHFSLAGMRSKTMDIYHQLLDHQQYSFAA